MSRPVKKPVVRRASISPFGLDYSRSPRKHTSQRHNRTFTVSADSISVVYNNVCPSTVIKMPRNSLLPLLALLYYLLSTDADTGPL